MRNWLFHPVIFYPLAILVAALAIFVSLRPILAANSAGHRRARRRMAGLQQQQFNSPDKGAEDLTVVRVFECARLRVAQTALSQRRNR